MDITWLSGGWEYLGRLVLVGTAGYIWLVLLLKVSGSRTLARMTPFDFVITVTLGSAFGRVLTASEVGLIDAFVAFALLVALQWLFAYGRAKSQLVKRIVDVEPEVLYLDGKPVEAALHRHRFTEKDLKSAVRENGKGSLAEVRAVLLQSDGQFAVIGADQWGDGSALPPPR